MAGKSVKNKRKYRALKRKGMSKSRAARIANAGKSASRKGGSKGGRVMFEGTPKEILSAKRSITGAFLRN